MKLRFTVFIAHCTPLYECTVLQFIHSSGNEHCSVPVFGLVHIQMQVIVRTYVFISTEQILRSGIARSYGKCMSLTL